MAEKEAMVNGVHEPTPPTQLKTAAELPSLPFQRKKLDWADAADGFWPQVRLPCPRPTSPVHAPPHAADRGLPPAPLPRARREVRDAE